MRRRHCHCALTRKICARASGDRPWVARKYSLRSMPEEKDSPAPVRTNTPQRSSVSIVSRTASISAASAGLIALRFSGLFIVTQATPVSYCTRTFLPPRSGVCLPPSDIFLLSPERVIALPRRPLIWDLRPEQDCILQDSPQSPLPGRVRPCSDSCAIRTGVSALHCGKHQLTFRMPVPVAIDKRKPRELSTSEGFGSSSRNTRSASSDVRDVREY